MGLWPFGKKEKAEDEDPVDFVSRVVTAVLSDGKRIRGKLVIHFREPIQPDDADRTLASAVAAVERASVRAHELSDLASSELSTRIIEELPENVTAPRSLEIVALHLVDEPGPSSVARLPSAPPPPKPASEPPAPEPPAREVEPTATKEPSSPPPAISRQQSSRPPPIPRTDDVEQPPPSVAVPASRKPSGQMLIARGARLIPFGATAEAAGKGLVPLMRDAATKLELGIFRAYDLVIVRKAMIDETDGAFAEAMVPVSTAPLGFFAESRSDELSRWEKTLGDEPYKELETEACAMVAFLLYEALRHVEVEQATITTVLERMSEGAFPAGKGAVASLGRYLHPTEGTAMGELAKGIVKAVGHADELKGVGAMLTPLIASIQDDLAIAAAQVRSGVAKP
jgi:hypothetical protein